MATPSEKASPAGHTPDKSRPRPLAAAPAQVAAGPAQVIADLDYMRRPALALQWSGTGQCWVILPGPVGDKIVFFAGTYSGTATCAVPKPEPPI
jgi:hypothetical protein